MTDKNSNRELKVLAKGGIVSLGASVLGRLFRVLSHILLARLLGPRLYGLFVLTFTITAMVQIFSLMGLHTGMLPILAKEMKQGNMASLNQTIQKTLALALMSSCLIFAAFKMGLSNILAINVFHQVELTEPLNIAILGVISMSIVMVITGFFRGIMEVGKSVIVRDVFENGARLLFILSVLVFFDFNIISAVWASTLASIAAAGFAIVLILVWGIKTNKLRNLTRKKASDRKVEYKRILSISMPMFISGFLYISLLQMDRLMIAYFLPDMKGSVDVGIYNVATMIALQLTFFFAAIINIASPMLAKAHVNKDEKSMKKFLVKTAWWSLIATSPLYMIVVFYARPILGIFGQEFSAGALALIVLATGQLYNVATGPVGVVLNMTGRQIYDLWNNIALFGLNLIFNILLIPKYGYEGAAIATFSSMLIIHTVRLIQVWKIFNIHPFTNATVKTNIYMLVVVMVALWTQYMSFGLGVQSIFFLAATLLFARFILKTGFDAEDKEVFYTIVAHFGRSVKSNVIK